MTKQELDRANQLCQQAGVWLVVDNTYENFTYDGREHSCVSGPHVINIFSMSKVRRLCNSMKRKAKGCVHAAIQTTSLACLCTHASFGV